MPERIWTTEQKQAIEARGGTLLISAAAGSGKTAVLVERIIRRITDEQNPCDADRLLVVTFTNAAAAQMRARLSQRVGELISQRPDDRNLRRQQLLLQNAHISTIHAFCLDLIRENFQKLGLAPDFRIADEKETAILRRDLLDEILEEHYAHERTDDAQQETEDQPFLRLSALLGTGRGDGRMGDTVQRLLDFIRSLPGPEMWLEEKLALYRPAEPLAETLWGRAALRYAAETLENAALITRGALDDIEGDEAMQRAYAAAFQSDFSRLVSALEHARAGRWDELQAAVSGFLFERLGALRGCVDEPLKERVTAARKRVKDMVTGLAAGLLAAPEAQVKEDLSRLYPLVQTLFEVTDELACRLEEEKRRAGALDFSDLEQLALRLLVTKGPDGALLPTETAREIAAQFDEILVDEYQDVNRAQETIFSAVSQDGQNLFLVGDVKQSIYRFRQAMPEIFIEKKELYPLYDSGRFPAKILLSRNFRSRDGVTGAVNYVFGMLMSKELGEITYDEGEKLIPAASFPPHDEADFELHLVDASDGPGGEDSDTLEARQVAQVMRRMVEEGSTVAGTDGPRPCRWGDFCVLLRSTTGHAETYLRVLSEAGIPVWADIANGYLGSYEVAVMLSMMRILDNPLQDVPLLAVMLSPVFAFTPDELAELRTQGRDRRESLYFALRRFAEKEPEGRFGEFLVLLDTLRRSAAVLPADRLILKIFEKTGFLPVCEAMPGGEKRRANLRLLLDYARAYEGAGYKGLPGFIRFIDRVRETKNDLAPASVVSESADVVRIMSIHKSKGLEFPFVFLCGCARQFNQEDTRLPAVFSPVYGFGSLLRDKTLEYRYTTLPREVVRLETRRSSLSEELRVLYVAMTRAKERLFCIMTLRNPAGAAAKAAALLDTEGGVNPFYALQSNSFSEWLLACALRHPACAKLRTLAGVPASVVRETDCRWRFVLAKPLPAAGEAAEQTPLQQQADAALLREINTRLAFRYPWQDMTSVQSKLAVSSLSEGPAFPAALQRPSFLEGGRLTGAEAGTALHGFMQHARLDALHTEQDVADEAQRLVQRQLLLPEEGAAVNAGRVLAFLGSPIYRRMQQAKKVYREFQFTLAVPAGRLGAAEGDGSDSVILQGMADVVFEELDGLYVLDYKTDHVADEEELVRRYGRQLEFYAAAAEQVMERPVRGKYLYSFHLGRVIELPISPESNR